MINYCFNFRSLFLAIALMGGLGLVTHATASRSYNLDLNTMTPIPLDGLGGEYTSVIDINDAGQAVGAALRPGVIELRGFITDPNAMWASEIGTLGGYSSQASGINNEGQVVGGGLGLVEMVLMPSSLALMG